VPVPVFSSRRSGSGARLADASVAARPADALRVYLDAVGPPTAQTGEEAYRQIARLLLSARDCHERLGTSSEFEGYLAGLRTSQRRKRSRSRVWQPESAGAQVILGPLG
jgi:hypothetical protein